jgi:hypothetical protein
MAVQSVDVRLSLQASLLEKGQKRVTFIQRFGRGGSAIATCANTAYGWTTRGRFLSVETLEYRMKRFRRRARSCTKGGWQRVHQEEIFNSTLTLPKSPL